MTQSKNEVPHYYETIELNAEKVLKLRQVLNENGGKFKLSVNDFIIKASALALMQVPRVNSTWQDGKIKQFIF